jgi:hypothetical protein
MGPNAARDLTPYEFEFKPDANKIKNIFVKIWTWSSGLKMIH